MCPIFSPFILLILFMGPPLFLLCSAATTWKTTFEPNQIKIHMHTSDIVELTLDGLNYAELNSRGSVLNVLADNNKLIEIDKQINAAEISQAGYWKGNVTLNALFLGNPNVYVELKHGDGSTERSAEQLPVIIIRETRVIDHIFVGSVATLVSILYINFGAALNLQKLRGIVRRPIGPSIGFFGQFLVMPLLSYGLGQLLFPDSTDMQLGMFFTGVSPAGGASNIWTVILGGNLDLSIAMTSISNIASFGMMPLWLFTLGKVIFDKGEIEVPYRSLSTYLIALIIPLIIGLLIQRFLPRVANILVRILKPVSALLILFIVIFAIVTNLYLFELFSWKIVIAGLGLPWLGYVLGWLAAKLFKQTSPDCLAIALETGIQNTGIAIFLLGFTLPQPQADLTTVVPVSVAIMTPVPLLMLYIYQKIRQCMTKKDDTLIVQSKIDESVGEIGEKATDSLRDGGDAEHANDKNNREQL